MVSKNFIPYLGQGIRAFSLEELSAYACDPTVAQSAHNFISYNEQIPSRLQRATQAFAALPFADGLDNTMTVYARVARQIVNNEPLEETGTRIIKIEKEEVEEKSANAFAERMIKSGITLDSESRMTIARDIIHRIEFFRSTFPPAGMGSISRLLSSEILVTLSAVRDAEHNIPETFLSNDFRLLRVDYSGKSFAWWNNQAVNRGDNPDKPGLSLDSTAKYYLSEAGDVTFVRGGTARGLVSSLFLPQYPGDHPRVYLEIRAMPS